MIRKRSVLILTRENHEKWFYLIKQFLISEELWHIVDLVLSTISIIDFNEVSMTLKSNAKTQYWISISIEEDDQKHIMRLETTKKIYSFLLNKYKKKLQIIERQFMMNLINYRKSFDKIIEKIWTEIFRLARKVCATRSKLKILSSLKKRLSTLLRSLSKEYFNIRDHIDAQDNFDLDIFIQKLQEKKAQLSARAVETEMWAKRKDFDRRHNIVVTSHRRNSSVSSADSKSRRKPRWAKSRQSSSKENCYICEEKHRVLECEFFEELRALRRKIVARTKTYKKLIASVKLIKKHRAYNVDDNSISDEKNQETDEEAEEEKIAALSEEMISKILKSHWVADIDASSHMTDQLQLFRSSLKSIRRRTIKIERGRLFSDQRETTVMRVKSDQCLLTNVLYVSNLGVNLLSEKKLCQNDLMRIFDEKGLYMNDAKGNQMLRASNHEEVYIVDKIASQLDEFALLIAMTSKSNSVALPALINLNEALAEEMNVDSSSSNSLDSFASSSRLKLYKLWHRRFAHLDSAKLRNLHKIITMKKPISIIEDHGPCKVCSLIKLINKRNHQCSERKTQILTLMSIDICDELLKFRIEHHYFLEIVNNYSRRTWFLPLQKRSDAVETLRKWKLEIELQNDAKLQAVRSDNVKELKFFLDEWCSSIGIISQYTISYNSIQNEIAERGIRITENQIRVMIKDVGLFIEFWHEASRADAYIRNRVDTRFIIDENSTTSIETFTEVKSSIDHFRVWECKCYTSVESKSLSKDDRKDKFMNRERFCVFLDYSDITDKQYYVWASNLEAVIRHHRVSFSEDEQWGSANLNLPVRIENMLSARRSVERSSKIASVSVSAESVNNQRETIDAISDDMIISNQSLALDTTSSKEEDCNDDRSKLDQKENDAQVKQDSLNSDKFSHVTISQMTQNRATRIYHDEDSTASGETKSIASGETKSINQQFLHVAILKRKRDEIIDEKLTEHRQKMLKTMLTLLTEENDSCCLRTTSSFEIEHEDWVLTTQSNAKDKFADRLIISISKIYEKTIADPAWRKLWKETIQIELTALIANDTWEAIVSSKDSNIVISKWVFKAKMHIDDSLDKLKARIVVRDFSQMWETDYTDIFASTMRFDILRLFLMIVVLKDLECHQVDVNNAFTKSFLKEKIYMKPSSDVDLLSDQVLLIRRSLYGLKQAARDWYERCMRELAKLDFEQTPVDPCMLRHRDKNIILLVYVDDINIAARSMKNINWFKNEFKKLFKVKNLKKIDKILDIKITRDRQNRTLRMNQSHYLADVLNRLHMSVEKHAPTELSMNDYDSLRLAEPNDERISQKNYQHAIESIMYVAIHTRSDIAFAVERLNQYLSDLAKHHEQALKTLLRYLRFIIDKDIVYESSESHKLIEYSDFDYAADKLDRKSVLTYVYMLTDDSIFRMSRKQKFVVIFTIETEYMSLSTCAKKDMWLIQLLKDMNLIKYLNDDDERVNLVKNIKHQELLVQIKRDNQAANSLVKNAHIHERSKHIDVVYHHVRDLIKRNLILLNYISSANMMTDELIKSLTKDRFKRFVKQLELQDQSWDAGSVRVDAIRYRWELRA